MWVDGVSAGDSFVDEESEISSVRFCAAIGTVVSAALEGGASPDEIGSALVRAFPKAVEYGLLNLPEYPDVSQVVASLPVEVPASPAVVRRTAMANGSKLAFGGFRPATVEPLVTHAWAGADGSRELRLFDKYLTWHYVILGSERFHVVPYRSISRLEYAVIHDQPVVFFGAGALELAIEGSQDEIAAIVDQLTAFVS
jgi:hypothetical protein